MYRILVCHGLIEPRFRRRKRRDYIRWEREAPMGVVANRYRRGGFLADGTECKVVTWGRNVEDGHGDLQPYLGNVEESQQSWEHQIRIEAHMPSVRFKLF